ncbi:hypothetical protein AALO_G00283420 [Alosa alosa]|uniref:RFX-type winged-helix domain-containing protein n=1 Tax=Alosa alosa TaxID=278164 RepID=A0AAV6FK36_9TELE|nr:hypothetical protein AALO_G00283420 [Alosa alosa]
METEVQWLLDNYETAEGVSLPRSTLYCHYLLHCQEQKLEPVNAASFGKLIRSVFNAAAQTLGTCFIRLRVTPRRLRRRCETCRHRRCFRAEGGGDDQCVAFHLLCARPTAGEWGLTSRPGAAVPAVPRCVACPSGVPGVGPAG